MKNNLARGAILGIRTPPFQQGALIPVSAIAGSLEEMKHIVWHLVQDYSENDEKLDQHLVDLHRAVNAKRPGTMAQLLLERKYELVWSSNAIEGNSLSLQETEMVLRRKFTIENSPLEDAMGALDGASALAYLAELAEQEGQIISEPQLLRLHSVLLHRTLTAVKRGEYRSDLVRVTGSAFVFPPPEEVPARMTEFLAWLNAQPLLSADPLEAITVAAEAHLRFVTIHPFEDGNGRMSRLLMNLVLVKARVAPVVIHPTSRQIYYAALKKYQLPLMKAQPSDCSLFYAIIKQEVMAAMELADKRAPPADEKQGEIVYHHSPN